jgi:hypothetical protein
MKKKRLTRDDMLNWWLKKYHGKTVEQVIAEQPKEVLQSPEWFKLYPVTKTQHDEWYAWAISALSKERKLPEESIRKLFAFDYLDCSPYCVEENQENDSKHRI